MSALPPLTRLSIYLSVSTNLPSLMVCIGAATAPPCPGQSRTHCIHVSVAATCAPVQCAGACRRPRRSRCSVLVAARTPRGVCTYNAFLYISTSWVSVAGTSVKLLLTSSTLIISLVAACAHAQYTARAAGVISQLDFPVRYREKTVQAEIYQI